MTTNYKYVIRRANDTFDFLTDISKLNIKFLDKESTGTYDVLYAYDPSVKKTDGEIKEDLKNGSSVIFDQVVKTTIEKKYNEGRAPKLATSIAVAKVVEKSVPIAATPAIVVAKPAPIAAPKPATSIIVPTQLPTATPIAVPKPSTSIIIPTQLPTATPIAVAKPVATPAMVVAKPAVKVASSQLVWTKTMPANLFETSVTPREPISTTTLNEHEIKLDEGAQKLATVYLQNGSSLYLQGTNTTPYYGLPNIVPKTFCYFNSIIQLFKDLLIMKLLNLPSDFLFVLEFLKNQQDMQTMKTLHFYLLKLFHNGWHPQSTLKIPGTEMLFTTLGKAVFDTDVNELFKQFMSPKTTTETIFSQQSPKWPYLFIKSLLKNESDILELPYSLPPSLNIFGANGINLNELISHSRNQPPAKYIFVSNFDRRIIVQSEEHNITIDSTTYELIGIIYMISTIYTTGVFNRLGGANHFMAITKQSDGKWYVFDDQNVAEITLTNGNILESFMPTFKAKDNPVKYVQDGTLKINDPGNLNGGIFALLYKKQPLPYVLVFSDFDGTLTRYNGNTLLKSNFYVKLYGFPPGEIHRATQFDFRELQHKYNSQINSNPTYAITDAAAELIKKVLTIPNGKFIIVTRNREDYVKLALQHKFKDNPEMLNKIEIIAVNSAPEAKNIAVTNYLASFKNQISCIYVFDDSKDDFMQMKSPAVNKISPDKVYGENKQPKEYEAYFKLITPQIKNCTDVFL